MNKILNITSTNKQDDNFDPMTRIQELEKELQRHRVEEGRLKKVQEELDSVKAHASELEAKISSRNVEEDSSRIRGYVPDNTIADPDTLDAVAHMTARTMQESEHRMNERFAQMETKMQTMTGSMSQRAISDSIEAKYPGLISRLNSGDLSTSWNIFLAEFDPLMGSSYSELAAKAYANNNENLMFYVIDKFLSNTGSVMQYGKETIAQPTSSNTQDISSYGSNKPIYNSIAEVEAMLDKATKDYSAGRITQREKNMALQEFNLAFTEGRILELKH